MFQNLSATRSGMFVLILASTVGVSCRREVSAAEMNRNENASPATELGAGPAPAARFDEAAFSLAIEPQGVYAVGKAATVAVKLIAKGPHHINQEYPHKLKLKATDGVTYPQTVIGRDAMKIENAQAQFAVPLTPNRSGKITVGGEFAFSLCTADRCLMEKRPLSLDIQVP